MPLYVDPQVLCGPNATPVLETLTQIILYYISFQKVKPATLTPFLPACISFPEGVYQFHAIVYAPTLCNTSVTQII